MPSGASGALCKDHGGRCCRCTAGARQSGLHPIWAFAQAREIAAAGEEDPLDAFMANEVLPEVKQAEAAEAAKREEARKQLAQQLAVRAAALP